MQLITTILNVYKRPQHLNQQYTCIKNQSINSDIWIDYTVPTNTSMYDLTHVAPEAKITTRTNQNLYHFGRFFYGLNVNTEYVFLCDDDILPGSNYLQHCIDTIQEVGDCVLTGYGLKFDRNNPGYNAVEKYGWHTLQSTGMNTPMEVDMGGHSWFLRREHLNLITRETPINFKNGEDLHFSYMLNQYGNIPIVVPSHKLNEPQNWSCDPKHGLSVGQDENATWRKTDHMSIRDTAVKTYLNKGWKLKRDN